MCSEKRQIISSQAERMNRIAVVLVFVIGVSSIWIPANATIALSNSLKAEDNFAHWHLRKSIQESEQNETKIVKRITTQINKIPTAFTNIEYIGKKNLKDPILNFTYSQILANTESVRNEGLVNSSFRNFPLSPLEQKKTYTKVNESNKNRWLMIRPSLFHLPGFEAIKISNTPLRKRWAKLLREKADRYFNKPCLPEFDMCRYSIYRKLKQIRDSNVGISRRQLLANVNRLVNSAIIYKTDWERYGRVDHWDKLSEIVALGSGDCEDFAIAKFWILASLGVPKKNMGLLIVRVKGRQVDHAVLAVNTASGVYYLDNRFADVRQPTQNFDYLPVVLLSDETSWMFGRRVASIYNQRSGR